MASVMPISHRAKITDSSTWKEKWAKYVYDTSCSITVNTPTHKHTHAGKHIHKNKTEVGSEPLKYFWAIDG